jgi:tetratricopeptide (TPR) repeat protein
VSAAVWQRRRRDPVAAVAWVSYLALLAPATGLITSGVQASADRYSYMPGVVVALAVAGVALHWSVRTRARSMTSAVAVVATACACACALASRAALPPWRDSISLWTRVVALDPSNDVALYNLGAALAAEGRTDEAAARYRAVLAIVPEHADAKANLDRLEATRLEQEANALAANREFAAAEQRYAQALARDGRRTHSHAGRGMALATLGRSSEAITELHEAIRQGEGDAAVANALGVLLAQAGRTQEARDVLGAAVASHPSDVGLAHNLARLLVTASRPSRADAEAALPLARRVVEATGGRDPRALETLATALAANGQLVEADAANAKAVALATAAGDRDLAEQITARRRAYRSAGQ